ncbi:MAG: Nif3-like dinuclear metal center hexameric protein [Desulfobacteraceae bacterium]|nr:Nif3-like dinuclear metal center hexameric protein [Desulfobacteraceae bacterium]
MTVRVKEILRWIDSLAPFRFAESWDNCGLQVGSLESNVERILVALDPGLEVLEEARDLKCECIVAHHPLLLRPIQKVLIDSWPGNFIAGAITAGISVVAAHTNIDAAREGTNAQLVALLGMEVTGALETAPECAGDPRYAGIGLVGRLPSPVLLGAVAARLKCSLGDVPVRMTGDPQRQITRAAVCTGSGASLIGKVLASGAEVYVTGDMKYHDARLAQECGLAVIDIGHFASEKLVLEPLGRYFQSRAREEGVDLEVSVSRCERDPFRAVERDIRII